MWMCNLKHTSRQPSTGADRLHESMALCASGVRQPPGARAVSGLDSHSPAGAQQEFHGGWLDRHYGLLELQR